MGGNPTAGRSIYKSLLEQEWFNDVLDGVFLFTDRRGQSVEANRASTEFIDDGFKKQSVHLIKPTLDYFQANQRLIGHLLGDGAVSIDFGEIPDPT